MLRGNMRSMLRKQYGTNKISGIWRDMKVKKYGVKECIVMYNAGVRRGIGAGISAQEVYYS